MYQRRSRLPHIECPAQDQPVLPGLEEFPQGNIVFDDSCIPDSSMAIAGFCITVVSGSRQEIRGEVFPDGDIVLGRTGGAYDADIEIAQVEYGGFIDTTDLLGPAQEYTATFVGREPMIQPCGPAPRTVESLSDAELRLYIAAMFDAHNALQDSQAA